MKLWGEQSVKELNAYQEWLHDHPHCSSPRLPGIDGPKPNQTQDESNSTLYYINYGLKDKPKP